MKNLIASLSLLTSLSVYAQTIKLKPGSSVTLEPAPEAEVICQGGSNSFYCFCEYSSSSGYYILVRRTVTGNSSVKDNLEYISGLSRCESAMRTHPACK